MFSSNFSHKVIDSKYSILIFCLHALRYLINAKLSILMQIRTLMLALFYLCSQFALILITFKTITFSSNLSREVIDINFSNLIFAMHALRHVQKIIIIVIIMQCVMLMITYFILHCQFCIILIALKKTLIFSNVMSHKVIDSKFQFFSMHALSQT